MAGSTPSTRTRATAAFPVAEAYVRPLRLIALALAWTTLALYGLAFLPRLYYLLYTLPDPRPPLSEMGVLILLISDYLVIAAAAGIGLFLVLPPPG